MKDELLYEQIIKEIRRKIESGEILPGDKAPSIAVIRREFHVSPVTAVRALKELTASGYLEKLPGRGYFAAERKDGRGKKNLCVGCLLRSNYVSLSDHYFNEIISGIQQAASLARVNLVWSYLSTHLCNLQTNLEQELVESALEMNEQVAGFLIDERVPDSAVREILAKTGKPAVMINRTTELPMFSVSPNYRDSILKLVETLLRMQYNRFIFAVSGMNNFAQQEKEAAFNEAIGNYALRKEDYRILPECGIVPFRETYRKLLQFREELKPGKLAVITSGDALAREMTQCLIQDGIAVPGDVGVAATDGLSFTVLQKPEITTLKIDTVKMGITAMNLLLHEIAGNSSEPRQSRLFLPNLIFGETI